MRRIRMSGHDRGEWQVIAVERKPRPHHVLPRLRTRRNGSAVCQMKIDRREPARDDRRGSVLKAQDLRRALRRVEDLGARDVREQTFQRYVVGRFQRFGDQPQVADAHAQPVHSRIHLQVYRKRPIISLRLPFVEFIHRIFQQLDVLPIPDRRREVVLDDGRLFAAPESA